MLRALPAAFEIELTETAPEIDLLGDLLGDVRCGAMPKLEPAGRCLGRASAGVLIALALLGACSNRRDPKACEERIARFEERFAKVAEPSGVALGAGGFDVPRAPRPRTQPLGADGLFVGTGYDAGIMTIRGFGTYAAFRGAPERGRPDIDATSELSRWLRELPAPPATPIPVYVAVPTRNHAVLALVDVLSGLDPIFELRLVVGIEGTEGDPVPADASDWVREPLQGTEGLAKESVVASEPLTPSWWLG